MLVIHWSPVKNTRSILKHGIRKSPRGLFCFPLTGHPVVDRCWVRLFRWERPRTQFNGFIFRVEPDDLPASFGSWVEEYVGGAPRYSSLPSLEREYRRTVLAKISDDIEYGRDNRLRTDEHLDSSGALILSRYLSDPEWCFRTFEDTQIILSRSISADRILRVIAGASISGRRRHRQFRYAEHAEVCRGEGSE